METNNWELISKIITTSATLQEQHEFEQWLNKSPENKEYFSEIKQYWESADHLYEEFTPDIIEAWQKVKTNTILQANAIRKINKINLLIPLSIAASILIIIGFGVKFNVFNLKTKLFEKTTVCYYANKSIEKVVLEDDTEVWLNRNSTLTLLKNFNDKYRKVELIGEAFFQVTHNQDKPFIIKSQNTTTKVLGTSFNISAYPDKPDIRVTVSTGKVLFKSQSKDGMECSLTPGEVGIFEKSTKKIQMEKNSDLNYLTWKTGKFNFKNANLENVCIDLTDYYHTNIKIYPNVSKELTLNGNFDSLSLDDVLDIVDFTFDLEHKYQGDSIILYNPDNINP